MDLQMVPNLWGRSYQCLLARQPVKLGGLGLRSLVETRHPAFLGGLEMAAPYLVSSEQCVSPLAPSLRAVMGSMAGSRRWAEMLEAGSCTSTEFRAGWDQLAGEARSIFTYLGEEPSGYLADAIEGVGGNSTDGSTRTKVVQEREGLRHKLLVRALAAHPHQDARPVTVYQNVSDDKCAGSWLLAIPNRDQACTSCG